MATRYSRRQSRTPERTLTRGLWPLVAEPGESFRWGCVLRASKGTRVQQPDGTVRWIAETIDRQDLELLTHIRETKMGIVVDSYPDVASAWRPGVKRPRYENALADLAAGRIDGIACLAVDRLTRRRDQVRPILNAVGQMKGRLFFLWDELDTISDDPDTELRLHELVARAEREAERTSRRYKLVAQHRARQGKHSGGGTRPFGHTLDWYALVPHEADAIRDAAKRVLEGEGVYSIVQDWNANGPRPVKAKQWTTQVLKGILQQPRLVAKRDYGEDLFDLDGVPPILDVDTFERVCAKLAEPKPHTGSTHTSRLLSGIAQCGRCAVPLRGGKHMQSRGGRHLYACPPKSRGQGSCGALMVNSDPVDQIVSERVVEWLSDKHNVTNLLALHSRGPEDEALTQRIAEINDALVDLSYLLARRKIRTADYEARWDELIAERRDKQRQRAATREAGILVEVLAFEDVAAEWESHSQEWRRNLLRLATERIVIEPVGKTSSAVKGRSGFTFNPERVRVTFAGE
jgi:site-specific DNA recombinase